MKTALIPVTDDGAGGTCANSFYEVNYRLSTQAPWIATNPQPQSPLPEYLIGSPAVSTPCVVIPGLLASALYYYQLRRWCCDGTSSNWLSGTITTGS